MPSLPRDRAYIEVTEAITWIAFGWCRNATTVLQQSIRAGEEYGRWDGWRLDDLEAYLQHVVEGTEFDEAGHGPANEWQPRVERLKRALERDERGLLDELRPYRAKVTNEKARVDAAERQLLEAARAERLHLLGTPVPRGAKPDGADDPEPIPVTYLLKPVAVSLSYNRLTCDWDADVDAIRGWSRDYADLRVKTADVALLWPYGGAGIDAYISSANAFDQPYWNLLQVLAWICARDRELVCEAADDATPCLTTLRFDIEIAKRRAVFYHREEAERAVRYAAQDEKLAVTGLRNGQGDRTRIPGLTWADLVFNFPHSSPPYATPRNTDSGAPRWNGLMFRRIEALAIWPAVPTVPTIAFLDLARAVAGSSTDERMMEDNLRRLRSDAVLGKFPSGTLGWNAREHLQRFDPEDPDEIVRFDPVTPIRIVHQLAEFGDAVAEAVLNLSEAEACRRIAEAALPPNCSRARVFIESLAVTKSEARRFCGRHGVPIPGCLWVSPIAWSEAVRVDAITVAELPSMPITEIARRWSGELGESGLGGESIWRTIWRAFWQGDLARNEGLIIPRNRHDSRSKVERFTRAKLLLAISRVADVPFALERQPDNDDEGRVTDATQSDYRLVADQWDELVRRIEPSGWRDSYIEPAMLEREALLAWCDWAGRSWPAFWAKTPVPPCRAASDALAATPAADTGSAPSETNLEPQVPTDWCDASLALEIRAELWLKATIAAKWAGTFEQWHNEAIDAGIDISERRFRRTWNAHATEEMKRPGPKTKNMPELPPR